MSGPISRLLAGQGANPADWARSVSSATGATRTVGPDGRVTTEFEKFSPQSIQKYMDPYVGNVLDRAAQEYMRNRGIERQGLSDAAYSAGAFGGARHGIVESEYDRNTGQNLSDIYTSGLSAAYDRAIGQREAERGAMFTDEQLNQAALQGKAGAATSLAQIGSDRLGRELQSSGALADIASTLSSLGYADADAQRVIGEIQREAGQGKANAEYEEFLRSEQFPYDQAQWYSGILSGTNVPRTTSQLVQQPRSVSVSTQPGTNNTASIIGGGLNLLGGLLSGGIFSSRDYKTDLETPRQGSGLAMIRSALNDNRQGSGHGDGALSKIRSLPVKNFRYRPGLREAADLPGGPRIGPMAEDWASRFGGNGKQIDVPQAIGALMQAVKELDGKSGGGRGPNRRKAA
jgi:hypothetical protein